MSTFSINEHFQRWVDKNWEIHKEAGNKFFKEGSYENAVASYSDALFIASGFDLAVPFFIKELQIHKPLNSAMHKFAQIPALCDNLKMFLSIPWKRYLAKDLSIRFPNLSGAICVANRSISYMQLYKRRMNEGALSQSCDEKLLIKSKNDANKARKFCPTYIKGHHRYAEANKLLGNSEEYNDVQQQLKIYSQLLTSGMKEAAAAAFIIGWIEIGELEVYSHYRRQEIYKQILSYDEKIVVSTTVSLVPIHGGQFITSSLAYIHDWVKVDESQLHVTLVDISNGSDLELPPNGRASAEGIKNALGHIASFFSELEKEGIHVVALMLGQGLVGMEKTVKESLRGVLSEESLGKLLVHSSAATYASELASGTAF
eukprot:gene22386-30637_t